MGARTHRCVGHPFCMVMDADGFFQLHDTFAWQPIRVCNPTNPNWLPCKHIVELEETVSIHNHAKGVPDATMTSVVFPHASGPKEPLKKKKKSAGTSLFFCLFFFQRLFWTGCKLERNRCHRCVGHPFCMVMDADGFFQLRDMFAWQPIRVCSFPNTGKECFTMGSNSCCIVDDKLQQKTQGSWPYRGSCGLVGLE